MNTSLVHAVNTGKMTLAQAEKLEAEAAAKKPDKTTAKKTPAKASE